MKENEEILEAIEKQEREEETTETTEEEQQKFLIFLVGSQRYGLYADEVREIIGGNPVFYLPFVPTYIRGLINRHGGPHTVFDVHALLGQEQTEANNYLILKLEDDNVAILISEVLEIVTVPKSQINILTSQESEMRFFRGSITINEKEVFILDLNNLLLKLEEDLEKV